MAARDQRRRRAARGRVGGRADRPGQPRRVARRGLPADRPPRAPAPRRAAVASPTSTGTAFSASSPTSTATISPPWRPATAPTRSSKTASASSRAPAWRNLPFSAFAPNQAWLEAALCAHDLTVWTQAAAVRRRAPRLRAQAAALPAAARRRAPHPPRPPAHAAPARRLALGGRHRQARSNASPRCPPDRPAPSTTPPSTPARAGTSRRAAPHREPAIAGARHPGQRSPRPANHAHSPKTRRHRPADPLEGLAGESRLVGRP